MVDRDRFGNTKCLAPCNGGVLEWAEINGRTIGERITIAWEHDGKVLEDQAFLTVSISDETGEKCVWSGSSRTVNGDRCIELNRSIGADGTVREEIQELPLGTVLTFISSDNPLASLSKTPIVQSGHTARSYETR